MRSSCAAARDVVEAWRQPLVEGREQRVVGDVGPAVVEGAMRVLEAGLEHPGGTRPTEHLEPGGPDAVEQRRDGGVAPFGRAFGGRQHQDAEAPFGAHPQVVTLGVPGQGGDALDTVPGGELEVGLVERGRHQDPVVGAPALGSGVGRQLGHDEERLAGERITFGQPGPGAVAHSEPAVAAGLRDAVGVGEGQGQPGRGHRIGRPSIAPLDARPASQLAGAPADEMQCRPIEAGMVRRRAVDESESVDDVGRQLVGAAPQHVALLEHGRERAGDGAEAEVGAGGDHAGQARMHRELGHGPSGVGDAPVGVERAEVVEQTPGDLE